MHPLKYLFLRLPSFGLVALFALTAAAQTASAEKNKPASPTSAARFELSWARPDTPVLQAARQKLTLLQQRYQSGVAGADEVAQVRLEVAEIEQHTPYLLSIESRGGTLRDFLAVVSAPEEVSFTLINAGEPADLDTPIPPFVLRNANWATVVEVLANFLETRGLLLKHAGPGNPAESKSLVCILRRVAPPTVIKPAATFFDSFPLGSYLTEQSIDDIVGAIRAGWELDSTHGKDALKLKFHQPTSILLVSGPPEAIMVASKVISQLKGKFDKDSKSNLKASEQNSPNDKK